MVLDNVVRDTRRLEVFVPEEPTSIPSGLGTGNVLDIFLVYRTAKPWEVQTQYALNSDHFQVTATLGGDAAKAKAASRIDWTKFKNRTKNNRGK